MDRDNAVQRFKSILQTVYDRYGEEGIEGVYLHGSVLFGDFDPETSDVDSVAITESSMPLEREGDMRDFVQSQSETLPDPGIRLLYHDELDGGSRRSHLASVINPEQLVYAFPDWEHAAGAELSVEDFDLSPINHRDMVDLRLGKIVRSREVEAGDWRYAPNLSADAYPYYVKAVSRLIHARQSMRRGERRPFSYTGLLDDAEGKEEAVVQAILSLRETRDYSTFQKHAELFQDYVEELSYGPYEDAIKAKRKNEQDEIVY